jgi:hypothetical protein
MPTILFNADKNSFAIRRVKVGEDRRRSLPRVYIDCNGSKEYLSQEEIQGMIAGLQEVVTRMRMAKKEEN